MDPKNLLQHEIETLFKGSHAELLTAFKSALGDVEHAAMHTAQKEFSRIVLKAVDSLISVTVKAAGGHSADQLSSAALTQLARQFNQLTTVLSGYAPLQVNVEVAKHEHGDHSPEAEAARFHRAPVITAVRAAVEDVFATLTGNLVHD